MRWVWAVCVGLGGMAMAQTPAATGTAPAPVQLSPEAAYQQALRPFELTRKSMSNWSDSEVGAFAVAMKKTCERSYSTSR